MDLAPQLEALAKQRDDLVVRRIDVVDWDSAVADQHGIESLPHLVLFEDGEQRAVGTRAVLDALQ